MEEWRQCGRWLIDCKVLPPNHRVVWPSAVVFDLAQALRDGVLLCQLLHNLSPGSIDLKDINFRPQMSQSSFGFSRGRDVHADGDVRTFPRDFPALIDATPTSFDHFLHDAISVSLDTELSASITSGSCGDLEAELSSPELVCKTGLCKSQNSRSLQVFQAVLSSITELKRNDDEQRCEDVGLGSLSQCAGLLLDSLPGSVVCFSGARTCAMAAFGAWLAVQWDMLVPMEAAVVLGLFPGLSIVIAGGVSPQKPWLFLCLKNIRTFLKVCHDKFGLRNSDLFDPFDLFDVRDFGKSLQRPRQLDRASHGVACCASSSDVCFVALDVC
ncbi:hypothetical protein BTVI_150090 [Pitangus sulphuratus]|nr:hypothetical protein BTVI_150090 [Pitangus sulphuratus]